MPLYHKNTNLCCAFASLDELCYRCIEGGVDRAVVARLERRHRAGRDVQAPEGLHGAHRREDHADRDEDLEKAMR